MEEWLLRLIASAGVGALAGGAVSVAAATAIARGSELGRRQEEARQRLLAVVRRFRAEVAIAPSPDAQRSSTDPDPLSSDSAWHFAEAVETELPHLEPGLTEQTREHLVAVVGPVEARSARISCELPEAERRGQWRAVLHLRCVETLVAEGLTEAQANDNGLLGKTRRANSGREDVLKVVGVLDAMEATLLAAQPRRRRLALPWGRS